MQGQIKVDYNKVKGRFEITTPYLMNGVAQAMPSRRWNKAARAWFAPAVRKNVEYIYRNITPMPSAVVSPRATAFIQEAMLKRNKAEHEDMPSWYEPVMPMRSYQKKATDKMYGRDNGALFMCMGSGKTKTTIDIVSAKAMTPGKKNIDALVIACPYSIRHNWIRQLQEHCPLGYAATVLDFKTRKGKAEFKSVMENTDKLRVLIVGIESLSTGRAKGYVAAFIAASRASMVVDESSTIKSPKAARTKNIISLGRQAHHRLILTGTPVTQGIIDLYSQMEFLDPDIIGSGDYFSFRNTYAVMGGFNQKEIIGYKNVDALMEDIRPAVYQVSEEEALRELPPKTYTSRVVPMKPEQKKLYKQLKDENLVHTGEEGEGVVVQNVLERLMRLQQMAGGFSVTQEVDPITEKVLTTPVHISDSKVDEVLAIAGESGASIIIWCRFRAEITLVTEHLRKVYGHDSTVEFHGGISGDGRWNAAQAFQHKKARFFVANQQTGGMGLDLQAATVVIFYSNSFSYSDRVQAEARNHRIGQTRPVLYIDLLSEGTVDAHVKRAIKDKGTMAAFVRDELRSGRNPLAVLA